MRCMCVHSAYEASRKQPEGPGIPQCSIEVGEHLPHHKVTPLGKALKVVGSQPCRCQGKVFWAGEVIHKGSCACQVRQWDNTGARGCLAELYVICSLCRCGVFNTTMTFCHFARQGPRVTAATACGDHLGPRVAPACLWVFGRGAVLLAVTQTLTQGMTLFSHWWGCQYRQESGIGTGDQQKPDRQKLALSCILPARPRGVPSLPFCSESWGGCHGRMGHQ